MRKGVKIIFSYYKNNMKNKRKTLRMKQMGGEIKK
jgi:hypothetical protein